MKETIGQELRATFDDAPGSDEYAKSKAEVWLFGDTWCDIERTCIVVKEHRRVRTSKHSQHNEAKEVFHLLRFHAGFPRVLETWRVPHTDGTKLKKEAFYRIEWTCRNSQGSKIVTEHDIDTGDWLARWGGMPISSRRMKDYFANVVKSQIECVPWGIDVQKVASSSLESES